MFLLSFLSDKGVDEKNAYIPALLAVSGVHNHLVRKNLRTHTSLIIESGEPRKFIILHVF